MGPEDSPATTPVDAGDERITKTVTEFVEFDGPHLLPAIDGWREVADFALDWAERHA